MPSSVGSSHQTTIWESIQGYYNVGSALVGLTSVYSQRISPISPVFMIAK